MTRSEQWSKRQRRKAPESHIPWQLVLRALCGKSGEQSEAGTLQGFPQTSLVMWDLGAALGLGLNLCGILTHSESLDPSLESTI